MQGDRSLRDREERLSTLNTHQAGDGLCRDPIICRQLPFLWAIFKFGLLGDIKFNDIPAGFTLLRHSIQHFGRTHQYGKARCAIEIQGEQ